MAKEYGLKDLKEDYEKLREKHSLPSFADINNDFEIEKLAERKSEILAREVRRVMIEKASAYLRFIEGFLNPSNAPLFVMAVIKSLKSDERKSFEEIYLKLGKYELETIVLDNIYNEEKEAEFISRFHKEWQEIKEKFDGLMKIMLRDIENRGERREKGYLG